MRPAQVLRRTAERKLAATVAETQGSLQDLAEAERETLSWQGAEKLMVAGFDRVEEHLLDDDFMVASADQYVGVAGAGLWRAVTNVLDAVDAAAAAGEPIDTTDKLKAYFAETTGENRWEKCTADLEPYTDAAAYTDAVADV